MYAKHNNHVTFFTDEYKENTDKVIYGRINEAIKIGKDENNEDIYEYQNWSARFVGKAYKKAKTLTDKTPITITEWGVYCPYNKNQKKVYPYIMVMNFEIRETNKKESKVLEINNSIRRDHNDITDLERMLLENSMLDWKGKSDEK